MKNLKRLLEKGLVWAVTCAVLLVGASSYTLLDAFVLPKSYQVIAAPAAQTLRTRSSATLGNVFGPSGLPWSTAGTTFGTKNANSGEIASTAWNPVDDGGHSTVADYQEEVGEPSDIQDPVAQETDGSMMSEYTSSANATSYYSRSRYYGSTSFFGGGTETTSPKATTPTSATVAATTTTTKATKPSFPIITDTYYQDEYKIINIQTVRRDNATCHIAEIWVADVSHLRTAFAKNTFGKNIKEYTSVMAKNNNAIFAISGDYYGFRDTGIIIRNGVLYRDVPRSAPDNKTLIIDYNGNMSIVTDGTISGAELLNRGVWQSWSFGPPLVENGKANKIETNVSKSVNNPRMAIGQLGPLHYLVVAVDGRTEISPGMTFPQLQQIFLEWGAITAYNLDGGGTATMWFNGKLVNNPTDGNKIGERHISDIIYL